MSERVVCAGQLYRHFKGKLYQIVTVAIHSETGEKLVIYQKLYDDYKIYARPYDMFVSEVDHVKYPEAEQKYRFELISDASGISNMSSNDTGSSEAVCDVEQKDDAEIVHNNVKDIQQIYEVPDNVDKHLIEFLDADTFDEKKRILVSIKNEITDRLIDDMAASIDVTVEAGDIEERYHSLMNCINARAKYEVNRLR